MVGSVVKTTRLGFLSFSTGPYAPAARPSGHEEHIQDRSSTLRVRGGRGQRICFPLPYALISKLCLLAAVSRERLEVCSNLIMYSTQRKSTENLGGLQA